MGEGNSVQAGVQASAASEHDDDLAVIREQSRETLFLLRQLIEMLLPKGDPNAPKLEDLIAALVVQQRETLRWVKQVAADQTALIDRLMGENHPQANGRQPADGGARA